MGILNNFPRMARLITPSILLAGLILAQTAAAQQPVSIAAEEGSVRLEADQQRKEGDDFFADGNVEIRYRNFIFRADHVQYNAKSSQIGARGHVQLDVDNQHLTADSADANARTGLGKFEHVHGEVRVDRNPNVAVLVTSNPLTFVADEVRRVDSRTYVINHAWLTVCMPDRPNWKFFTTRATLHVDRSVALVNANFRLFRIPLIYLPYATAPAGRNLRQSGFLLPEFSSTSLKGIVLGDAYYWAPKDWTDTSLGAAILTKRGWQQNVEFRAKPWENVSLSAQYFGVMDRGLENAAGARVKQGGHDLQVEMDARLRNGWRAVADFNQLTSLTFRLAFAPTFGEAINSEVRSTGFLSNNFRGFSVSFAGQEYKNYLEVQPETRVVLRSAPETRFSSVDQSPWKKLPIYFGFDSSAADVHRQDTQIDSPSMVERTEFAPRVVVPLHWGAWFGVTTSYAVRTTSYGAQELGGAIVNSPLRRTTGELSLDIRPPSLERVWQGSSGKWKHTIEPEIQYNFVRGVNQFERFIRFDSDDTLTDTNEVRYSITQRIFHRAGEGQADELVSWRIAQKYFFDPTFNGAIIPGTRNVFQALDSITPFAFADQPRHFSPIESDLRVTPGGVYDAQVRLEYDTARHRVTTAGTLLKFSPYQQFNFTLEHFSIDNSSVLQPLANQIRTQVGYGELNRRGWNVAGGFSYDIKQQFLQSQLVQVSYNGSCCGIALEYRRLALGSVRTENQFRVALIIANLGTFGNLRRQEKIF
jgi:LPS-assembly protein